MDKSNKPADLTKGSAKKNAEELPQSDLDKVTGGIKGPSKRDGHEDEIEIHGIG